MIFVCAGCGDDIPEGTPPYPGDMSGTGRLCVPCHKLIVVSPDDELVACAECPGEPLFYASELAEHRAIAGHPAAQRPAEGGKPNASETPDTTEVLGDGERGG